MTKELLELRVRIGAEAVNGDDDRHVIFVHVLHVCAQVLNALFERRNILLCKLCLRHAAIIFQRPKNSSSPAWTVMGSPPLMRCTVLPEHMYMISI